MINLEECMYQETHAEKLKPLRLLKNASGFLGFIFRTLIWFLGYSEL